MCVGEVGKKGVVTESMWSPTSEGKEDGSGS